MVLFTADLIPDNAVITLYRLLRGLRARVTASTVSKLLLSHPDYPSILALSDALTEWNVDNTAVHIKAIEQLYELPTPFVAHLNQQGGRYVLVKSLKGNLINYQDSELGYVLEPLAEFEKQWSRVVLLAETNERSGESNYDNKRKKELLEQIRGPILIVGAVLTLGLVVLSIEKQLVTSDWLLLLTKFLGLFACVFLVEKTMGKKNILIDQLCNLHRKANCDNVLNSSAAKLWGWLSWTDIGLIYFGGGVLSVLLVSFIPSIRPLLSWMALLALPYVVFSVYYQGIVAKQWCILCVSVQFILLAEGVLAITKSLDLPSIWQPYATVSTAFLFPTILWIGLKPLLESQAKSKLYYTGFMKLWRDPGLFKALLMQQSKMPAITSDMHSIRLGSPEATHTITMITNPYCNPCAHKHQELEDLIKSEPDINAQIVFSLDGVNGQKTKVALHTMALEQSGMAQIALTNWYKRKDKDYECWAADYPATIPLSDWEATLERNSQWFRLAHIDVTPTLFINGYKLPKQYQVKLKRLRYLINNEAIA